MYFLPLCGLIFYNLIQHELELRYDKKISNNYSSGIHIIFTIIIYILNNYNNELADNLFILNSTGYFINDLLFLIKNREIKLIKIILVYHHLFSTIYIINKPNNGYVPAVLFWAEISNIPSNVVYHYIKTPNKTSFQRNIQSFCEKIQFAVYSVLRIFYITYLSYNEYNLDKTLLQEKLFMTLYPLIAMGWLYSYVLLKKNCMSKYNDTVKCD
uniref:Uncharacterized protein n=1 Tax=viral metagenome TaxID=1070528 RepID=A0A6C0LX83_9ZZZZ